MKVGILCIYLLKELLWCKHCIASSLGFAAYLQSSVRYRLVDLSGPALRVACFRDRWRKAVKSRQLSSEWRGHVWTAAITWMSAINSSAAALISHYGPLHLFSSRFFSSCATHRCYFQPAAYSKGQWSNYFIKLHLGPSRWLILAWTLKAVVWSSVAGRQPGENNMSTSNWTNVRHGQVMRTPAGIWHWDILPSQSDLINWLLYRKATAYYSSSVRSTN